MQRCVDSFDFKACDRLRRNNHEFGYVEGFRGSLAAFIATKTLVVELGKVAVQDERATVLQMKDFVSILYYKALHKRFPKFYFFLGIFDSACNNLNIKFTTFAFVLEV